MKTTCLKKFFAGISALLMLCFAASACADKLGDIRIKGKIKVGVDAKMMPFVFWHIDKDTKEQTLAGADIELAKAVAEAIGVDIEFSDQAFSGLLTALAAGDIDIVCSAMSVRDERREVADFSDPYYYSRDALVVRAVDDDKYNTPADFAGKKIGVITGSTQMQLREKQFPEAEEVLLQGFPLLFMELVSGGVDGILVPELTFKQYFPMYEGKIAQSGIETDSAQNPVAIAVGKGDNASLLEKINEAIADFIKDDKYGKSLDRLQKAVDASGSA